MTQDSTAYDRETVSRFQKNPVGLTVELLDGSHREVREFRDTEKGRWLRIGRRWAGPWIPESDVAGVVVFQLSVRPEYWLQGYPRRAEK